MYVKYINELSSKIAFALRWASEDIAATDISKWYYCGCGGPESSQYMRSWMECDSPGSENWMIYTVSVTLPRYDHEMVRDLLRNAADRVSAHRVCEHQCTHIYNPRFGGWVAAVIYVDTVQADKDQCVISATAVGPTHPPLEEF